MINGVSNCINVNMLMFLMLCFINVKWNFIKVMFIIRLIIVFLIEVIKNCWIVLKMEKVLVINIFMVILNEMIFVVLLSKDLFLRMVIEFFGKILFFVIVCIVIVFVG